MALELVHWFIIAFLLILPILYELSSTFRFHAKFAFYYFMITAIACCVCVYAVFRPGDVNNHWFILVSMKYMKVLFGMEVEIRGKHNLDSKSPYIMMVNHQSSLDCFGMFEVWPDRCVCLVKKELMYAGPFGIASLLCGVIFVDRLNHDKALETMKRAAKEIHEKNVKVMVFPEGTRNHEGGIMPFKKGGFHLAVQAQVPIVPVVFSSYSEFYSKKENKFNPGKFIATVLPGIPTEGMTSAQVPELTERVRKQMLDVYNQTSLEATQTKLASKIANGTK